MKLRRPLIACALLTLTACGPTLPINAGLRKVGENILFGRPVPSPSVAPAVAAFLPAPLEVPPAVPTPPPATFQPPLGITLPPRCPDASPLAVPALEAPASATKMPDAGNYPFRYQGTITVDPGKPDQTVTNVPTQGIRKVVPLPSAVPSPDGHYSFAVEEDFNANQLVSTFTVYPSGHLATPVAGLLPQRSPDAGVYLTQMAWRAVGQPNWQVFAPQPPVQVDVFDNFNGQTWQGGAGSDAVDQRTLTVDANAADPNSSVVTGPVRVNACGDVIQAWEVKLAGTFGDPRGNGVSESYTLVLDFAPQYGGFSVQDHLVLNDTDPKTQKPRRYEVTATIDQLPAAP